VHEYVPTALADGTTNVPVHWSLLPDSQLCIVTGQGAVHAFGHRSLRGRHHSRGRQGLCKLVDMTTCVLALDHDDLESVAHDLVEYGWGERAGPVAMIVDTAFNLDMAVLVKQRVGDSPFRIFTNLGAARDLAEGFMSTARAPCARTDCPSICSSRLACIEQSGELGPQSSAALAHVESSCSSVG